MRKEVGIITNCLVCDSYFVMIIANCDEKEMEENLKRVAKGGSAATRKRRRSAVEDYLDGLSNKFRTTDSPFYRLDPCPSCIEFVADLPYREWLAGDRDAVLSPCVHPVFDSREVSPPLFASAEPAGARAKWKLVAGLGPPTLELDRSRSNRIFKKTLQKYGVANCEDRFMPATAADKGRAYENIVDTVTKALRSASDPDEEHALVERLCAEKPLAEAERWSKLEGMLTERAMAADLARCT